MIFRTARHTHHIERIKEFYSTILGLELLGSFEDHDGYSGIFLGKKDQDWHLEFTTSGDKAMHHFDDDDILVFYPQTREEYETILNNIGQHNLPVMQAKNPYWNENGVLIRDPEGYNLVISHLKIENKEHGVH